MKTGNPELEKLGRAECLRLLTTAPVGRVVFTTGGLPAVEPVSFLVDGGRVLFRTREDSKLATVGDGAVVAFQADHLELASRSGWSVTVVGEAHLLDDGAASRYHCGALHRQADGTHDDVIAIDAGLVNGRRLSAARN